MFFYLPFFMFAGAILYAFPSLGLGLAALYAAALLWPRFWAAVRNGPRIR